MSDKDVIELSFDPDGACFPDARVTLRTNGRQGGDGGHGGFVEITFEHFDTNGLFFEVEHGGKRFGDLGKLVLRFRGDWEYQAALTIFDTLAESLSAILAVKSRDSDYWPIEEKTKALSQIVEQARGKIDWNVKPKDPPF